MASTATNLQFAINLDLNIILALFAFIAPCLCRCKQINKLQIMHSQHLHLFTLQLSIFIVLSHCLCHVLYGCWVARVNPL